MQFLTAQPEASTQQTLCSLKGTFLIPLKRNVFLTAIFLFRLQMLGFFFHSSLGNSQSSVLFPKTTHSVCLVLPNVNLSCWLADSGPEPALHSFSGWQCWTQKLFCCLSCHKVPSGSFSCSLAGFIDRKHNYIACVLRDPQPLLCDWLCIGKQHSTGEEDLYREAAETEKRPSLFWGWRKLLPIFSENFYGLNACWRLEHFKSTPGAQT